MALRVNQEERHALLDCDLSPALRRAIVGPADPAPPRPPARHDAKTPVVPGSSGEPVALLTEQSGTLTWTVGVAEHGSVLASQPPPDDDTVWAAAWHAAGRLPVVVDELAGARRLTTPTEPALATAALARTDLRELPVDSALVLSLPQVVVVAPPLLASRVALHAYPARVHVLTAAALPPYPLS